MLKRLIGITRILGLCLLVAGLAAAQSPPSEQMAAARELVVTTKSARNLRVLMPVLVKNLQATMLIGRSPEFVHDF